MLEEKFHWFLNKIVTISVSDREKLGCFTEAVIVVEYAWSSTPIDSTVTIRSIPVIEHKLYFPLGVFLDALPKLTSNQTYYVVKSLRLADSSKDFPPKS